MSETYTVRDGTRLLTFTGRQLAHISSRRQTSPRWTEMSLYRTTAGAYVYEKVGKSVVVHMPECTKTNQPLPRFQEAHPGEDPDVGFEYCGCVPEEYDFTKLLCEEDRYATVVSDDPEGIVEALYRRRGGTRQMPQMEVSLLEAACREDDELRQNVMTEERID